VRHDHARRPSTPIRVAVPLLPQASFASLAAFYEDFRAVNTLSVVSGARSFDCRLVAEAAGPFKTVCGGAPSSGRGLA